MNITSLAYVNLDYCWTQIWLIYQVC